MRSISDKKCYVNYKVLNLIGKSGDQNQLRRSEKKRGVICLTI